MRGKTSLICVLSVFICGLLLGGCGSGNKESGSDGTTATSAAISIDSGTPPASYATSPAASTIAGSIGGAPVGVIGTASCANCHRQTSDPATAANSPIDVYKFYINGAHANQPAGIPVTDPDAALCGQCHDPLGDAAKLVSSGNTGLLPAGGQILMVGCEGCHGGGNMHWGVGPLPADKPRASRCGACHGTAWNSDTRLAFHSSIFPEGVGVYEDYAGSQHTRSVNSSVLANATDVRGTCGRCHTDEGAKILPVVSGTLVSSATAPSPFTDALAGRANVANASAVQCRTCHLAHDVGTTLARPQLIGELDTTAPAGWSVEFKTCTYCHQLLQASGAVNVAFHDPTVSSFGKLEEVITDTHFSVAGTPGYNINPADARACSNCHNPHKANNTINNQFAASAHFDPAGSWLEEGGTGSASCQRCHTTTGFRAWMNQVAANNNGAVSITPVSQTLTGPGLEMLYCQGCHTDTGNRGALRNPLVWQYTIGNNTELRPNIDPGTGVARTIPTNIGGALLCVHCHNGRRTGQYVKAGNYRTDHYLPAASIMFRLNGFEFTGIAGFTGSYDNVPTFAHDKVGTSASSAPGNLNGPCVGCHMYPGTTPGNHVFKVFTRDATTKRITAILANANTCSKCHANRNPTELNNIEDQFHASVQALKSLIATKKNLYYKEGDIGEEGAGNFYPDPSQTAGTQITTAQSPAAWGDINTFGTGYNLNLLSYALPGAGAMYHNFFYVKRLLYDSIDFLDDGLPNSSVDATVAAMTETSTYGIGTITEFQITATDKARARAFLGATRP